MSLLVVDGQGMIDQNDYEFSIINQPPLAKLSISGESLSDGDKMQLSDLSEWDLDATQSLDTTNDIEGLRCVWKINYKTIYEGCERTLQWPVDDNNDTILLTLDVIDDDEEYSSITVELSRANDENFYTSTNNSTHTIHAIFYQLTNLFKKEKRRYGNSEME